MRTRVLIPSAVAASVVVSLGPAAPVFASSPGHAARGIRGVRAATSPSFAGYSVQGGGEGSWKVAAQFVVPKLRCTGGSTSPERAIDPSVGVHNASSSFSSAGMFVGCYKGKAHHFLALVLNGSAHNFAKLAAHPGDTVAVRVSQTSKSTTVSSIDKSRKSVKKTLKGAGSVSGSAPWVGDTGWDNPGLLGVPNFGKVDFSNATLDGKPFGSAGPVRWERVSGSTTQIRTGSLSGNKSFETVFKHS
ncbi:MAG TPA: G1 family glutamic endopeptidase [Solirubrobacteraceae bacterium]